MSLKYKILLYVFLPIAIALVIALEHQTNNMVQNMQHQKEKEYTQKLQRIIFKLKSNITYFKNTTLSIARLLEENKTPEEYRYVLNAFLRNFEGIIDFTLVARNSFEITRVNKYKSLKEKRKKIYFKSPFYQFVLAKKKPFLGNNRISKLTSEPIVDVAVPVKNRYTGKIWAILKITFSGKINTDYLENEVTDGFFIEVFNTSKNQSLLSFGKKTKVNLISLIKKYKNQEIIRNQEYFIVKKKIPQLMSDLFIYIAVPIKTLMNDINKIKKTYTFYTYGAILVLFFFFYISISSITAKLKSNTLKITNLAQKLSGEKDNKAYSKDEIARLSQSITLLEIALEKSKQKDKMLAEQKRLSALADMLTNIAHQWRQPLNVISLEKDLFIEDYYANDLDDKKAEEFREKLDKSIQFLSRTIDDFRTAFASQENIKPFDIIQSIKNALKLVLPTLEKSNIKLTTLLPKEPVFISGVENQFCKAIAGIINNSIDAILKNNVKNGIIGAKLEKKGKKIILTIQDNGGGIDKKIIDRVFEPYFTTKFKAQGVGMGLFMSKAIIENMGGSISIQNEADGAKVVIIFNQE